MTWKKSTSVAATQRLMEPAYFQAVNSQLTFSLPSLGDFSMPMCTAIGWPLPYLQRLLFAVDWVLQIIFALVYRVVMPERIKSALKIKSEKESRNVFTHLQRHDSLVLNFRDASCLDSSLRLITLVCIRRWSYWETFYRSEYCDSQLFLTVTSHVKEAHFSRVASPQNHHH